MSIELVMPANHVILCQPLFFLPSIFPSIRVFSSESAIHIRWPKYWSFSFSIRPSKELSGLISLRLTGLISLLSKGLSRVFYSTTVRGHKFFSTLPLLSLQLLHAYMTFGKSIALTVQTSVGMWCFCFYHTVEVCHSFPAKKELSSNFMAAVTIHGDFRGQEEEICQCFHLFPFYLPWK